MAYLATSAAFGVTARQVGIPFIETTLMSVLVYAGSAQMIALGLIAGGASIPMIAITTFLVNLRHLLMGAALCPTSSGWKTWQRIWFGCQMTDESFAVVHAKAIQEQVRPGYALRVNDISHSFWIGGTVLGYLMGGAFDLSKIGLDYAMTGMLLGLWVIQVKSLRHFLLSVLAGVLSLGGTLVGLPTSVSMLIAAVICPSLAWIGRRK